MRSNSACQRRYKMLHQQTETLKVALDNDGDNLIMGVVYRPPDLERNVGNSIWDEINKT